MSSPFFTLHHGLPRQPFLDELAAAARGLAIRTVRASMADLPFPDASFDVLWAEGSVYNIGFDTVLRAWRRLRTAASTATPATSFDHSTLERTS